MLTTFLRDFPMAAGETVGFIALRVLVLGVGGLLLGFAWRSGPGLRVRGFTQAARVRVLGPPKPKLVELGPDGAWRERRDPREVARERRAGRAIGWIVGLLILLMFAVGIVASLSPA